MLNRIAGIGNDASPGQNATGFALMLEKNLVSFSAAIAAQLEGTAGNEQDQILRLTFAALRARQELREVLR